MQPKAAMVSTGITPTFYIT